MTAAAFGIVWKQGGGKGGCFANPDDTKAGKTSVVIEQYPASTTVQMTEVSAQQVLCITYAPAHPHLRMPARMHTQPGMATGTKIEEKPYDPNFGKAGIV